MKCKYPYKIWRKFEYILKRGRFRAKRLYPQDMAIYIRDYCLNKWGVISHLKQVETQFKRFLIIDVVKNCERLLKSCIGRLYKGLFQLHSNCWLPVKYKNGRLVILVEKMNYGL